MKRFVARAVAALGLGVGWVAAAGGPMGDIEVGKPFPALTFALADGGQWSIAEARGKRVVLHVFASW